ncbi:MAG TPA: S9 family peptidase [Steroidobacteraceae bacterium]|jgi:dipeptidyl aminopeptidase/acylaminoacyl peptidase|nr:S9 family peptidase [Steroidobacteraceae bacterium]
MRKLSGYRLCSALALLSAIPVGLHAEAARDATLAESLSRASIRAPALSPDARAVAYLQRETHWKENEFVWQLWRVNVAGGEPVQLTRGQKSVGPAQWSPDGRWLAFVTEREAHVVEPFAVVEKEAGKEGDKGDAAGAAKPATKQIWMMPPDGGEAWPLTKSETDVENFHWAKDGKAILFTAAERPSKASKARKDRYSAYDVVEKDYEQNQLWWVDAAAAIKATAPQTAKQLTFDPALNINSFAISADGTRVAFSAARTPLLAFLQEEHIYLMELPGAGVAPKVSKIVALTGPDSSPMFSPDGKQLAFVTSLGQPKFFYANSHIGLVDVAAVLAKPASAPADVRDLTKNFDEDPRPLDWVSNGLYFGATQRMTARLFRLETSAGQVQPLSTQDALIIDEASVTPDGAFMAFTADDATHLTELYVSGTREFAPRKLTDLTAQVRGWKLGSVEVVSWKSKDGTLIEGVLHKPDDYDPKRKYPLLVKIHGGPTGVSQPRYLPSDYAYPVQAFLAKGALVLEPNYRGSAGYGAKFRALNVRNLGVGDMWDVMSGIDALIAKGIVDPNRLAAMGWSQGGYISAFLTTHTDRFKAISVGAGISDWATYYVSTDITPFTPQYLGATPWDDPQIYAKTSPITTIRQAKTPTLIQHGSADRRVPVPDAFELYRGLLDQHVDARLILYTGFGHGIDKPKSALALLQANLDWFSHYVWGEPIPKDSALYGSSELETTR